LTVYDAAGNNDTDTCTVSVLPPSIEQNNTYNVNDTGTTDGNNVTIDGTDITGESRLNDTVLIELDNGTLVINIDVDELDHKNGTVTSVTLDTPAVTSPGTWDQNESVDVDLNLNESVWDGANSPKLTLQPLNSIDDARTEGWSDDAVENATSAISTLSLRGLDTAMVVHVTLSGIDESDVNSLPIEMTVREGWYNGHKTVHLFKFDENGDEKQRKKPTSVSHDAPNGTYTFRFKMEGFSIFALVGGSAASTISSDGGSSSSGGGTYPPGWGWLETPAPAPATPPAMSSVTETPVERETPAKTITPTAEWVTTFRTEPPSLPSPILSPTAGIVIVAVAAIFGIVMVTRATEEHKKATIATIGIVIIAVAAIIGMMLM
jgi:hypothetical protein